MPRPDLLIKIYRRFPGAAKVISKVLAKRYAWFKGVNVILTYRCNLNCAYCYAKGLKRDRMDMDLNDFYSVVKWVKRNGRNKLILLGGEPTIHHDFSGILKACREESIALTILTNLTCRNDVLESLIKYPRLFAVQVNVNDPSTYHSGLYEVVLSNLKRLKANGIYFVLRYNLQQENDEFESIISLARKMDCHIRFSLVNSPISCEGSFKRGRDVFDAVYKKERIKGFIRRCDEVGIFAYFARPVPRCLFGEKEISGYRKNGIKFKCYIGRDGDYSARMNVSTDLTVLGCYGVPIRGPKITSFGSSKELSEFYRKPFEELRKTPLMDACKQCKDFKDQKCQGGCLSEKREWEH